MNPKIHLNLFPDSDHGMYSNVSTVDGFVLWVQVEVEQQEIKYDFDYIYPANRQNREQFPKLDAGLKFGTQEDYF